MQVQDERIGDLVIKYLRGTLSESDRAELQEWRDRSPANQSSFEEMTNPDSLVVSLTLYEEAESEKEAGRIKLLEPALPGEGKVISFRSFPWRSLVAAASVLLIVLTSAVIWYRHRSKNLAPGTTPIVVYKNDISPGGDKAVLTLGDGSKIVLDNAQNGALTQQGNTKVIKLDSGQVVYNVANNPISNEKPELIYNTITTPRGGQYQVKLSDGTRVWLNAISSLKFPTAFTGNRREVEITGEAYFEVAQNKAQPFVVQVGGAAVTVLGTNFNVMAYPDEKQIKTTLLSGAVNVRKGNYSVLLRPGQQALVDELVHVSLDVNTEESVAWKNGLFEFNSAGIETVMRAISRWYDVDIRYEAQKDRRLFTGQISRTSKASEVLQILATTGLHFKINGNVITVLP